MKQLLILLSIFQLSCERNKYTPSPKNESKYSAGWLKISQLNCSAILIAEKNTSGELAISFAKGEKNIVDLVGFGSLAHMNALVKIDKTLDGYFILNQGHRFNDDEWSQSVTYYPIRLGRVELKMESGNIVEFVDLDVAKKWAFNQIVCSSN